MPGEGSRLHLSDLPEGRLPADWERHDGIVVHSLTAHALESMERHKWIESEKSGHDRGEGAFQDWLERFWKGYVRSKLMEHLYGWRCWGAFEEADHGLLRRSTVEFHVPNHILHRVAEHLAEGGENLDVIDWVLAENAAGAGINLDAVLWLLDRIDINAKRHRLLTDHIRLFIERKSP
jgi:hypothetical protein